MVAEMTEKLGEKIRRQRHKLGLTLYDLAEQTGISTPYLSLIENNRVPNPPSDEKLRKLEHALQFGTAELVCQAHLQRTPADVREILMKLSGQTAPAGGAGGAGGAGAMRVSPEAVGCPDVTDKDSFAVRVSDDSMTPNYRLGDIVIFSPALTAHNGDDCYVRMSNGRTVFGRVFFESEDGEPVVRLQPRNERRRPTIVPAGKVKAIHKAVFKYQRVEEG